MDFELTIAAIQQDRDAAYNQLARQRAAREIVARPGAPAEPLSASNLLSRTARALARLAIHPMPNRRQA
jgi:hypothetical protein